VGGVAGEGRTEVVGVGVGQVDLVVDAVESEPYRLRCRFTVDVVQNLDRRVARHERPPLSLRIPKVC